MTRRCAVLGWWVGGLILASACGPGPDLRSRRGTAIYLEGVQHTGMTPEVADAMESFLIDRLVAHGWSRHHLEASIGRTEVHFVSAPWVHQGELWGGSQEDHQVKVAVLKRSLDCPWQGAYRHELAHWLQLDIRNLADSHHKDARVWTVANDWSMGCQAPPMS